MDGLNQSEFEMCRNGDVHSLLRYLEMGGNPNVQYNEEEAAIIPDDNDYFYTSYQYVKGDSLLKTSILFKMDDCVDLLLKYGANPNIPDEDGDTPLHFMYGRSIGGCLEMLLKHGANVNAQNKDGQTPLHCVFNSTISTQILLDHGANPSIPDKDGFTPLHLAARGGVDKTVELLMTRGANIDAQDCKGKTPLHLLALYNYKNLLKCMLDYGANPFIEDDNERTFLDYIHDHEFRESIRSYAEEISTLDIKEPDC